MWPIGVNLSQAVFVSWRVGEFTCNDEASSKKPAWQTSLESGGRVVLYPEGVTRHSPGSRSAPWETESTHS